MSEALFAESDVLELQPAERAFGFSTLNADRWG